MAKTIRLKNQKRVPALKYNINAQIQLLPREFKINDILAHLSKSGITRDEFYRDRSIQFDSEYSIPSDRLIAYAQMFDCSIENLMNNEIKTKSLRGSLNPVSKVSIK